ncbi:MAG: trypsin-like peptidase domain-containing protein [Sporichthyaceae bacterium]
MDDEKRPGDDTADDPAAASPWWAGPGRDVWGSPVPPGTPADRPGAPTRTLPDESSRDDEGRADTIAGGRHGDGAGTESPAPSAWSVWDDRDRDDTVVQPRHGSYDVWAPTDSMGRDPRPSGPRTPVLVALAAVIALLAGGVGGGVGYLLADRSDGSRTIDGASLGSAPAKDVQRPAGSIPGIAAKVLPSVVQIKVRTSQGQATGSGFVVDENGIVVTNNHVVADAQGPVELTFSDGTTTNAEVVGTSASYDLAALRLDAKNLPALPLGNSDSVVVGDTVIAIGSPLGLSGTVTSGIISAKNRPVTAGAENGSGDSAYINAIQTDAAINPGNSGGPLVDIDGEVIGVNSAIATVGGGTFGQEAGNIGVGFAIPINQVRRTVEQLLDTGKAQFPVIGASLDGTYNGQGARIATGSASGNPPLVPGGPAEKAGVEAGDVVVAIDGKAVADSAELIVAIRSRQPGDTVTLTVRRNGSEQDVDVTLDANEG